MEVARRERDDQIIKAPASPLASVGTQGAQFSGIAASLMVSRMSTAGFFAEAMAQGVQVYKVSEVMDGATCLICREMNNQEFPVSAGVAQSTSIMQATDPDSLKQIAPWPSQSAANVNKISRMNQGALINAGLNLPPYHPWCRGIATIIPKGAGVSSQMIPAVALGQMDAIRGTEGLDPDALGNRLFGDISDLELQQYENMFGIGLAGLLLLDDEEEEETSP